MDIGIIKELDPQHMPESVFVHEATQRDLRFVRAYHWETTARKLASVEGSAGIAQHIGVFGQGEETFTLGDALVFFQLRGDDAFMRVATQSPDFHGELERAMKVIYEPVEPVEERHEIELIFWRTGAHGSTASPRTLQVDPWLDIATNYSAQTRARLEQLVVHSGPPGGGRMVLWYGDPGTGKTKALQSLAWEWREWASFHYITDPERLFGDADYMMEVVLFQNPLAREKWKVLILEDTGELLTPDAKVQAGQGLSRLLNLTDGLIGRLTKLILLVTTNEEVGTLHPAVARPGRCTARIEFAPFTTAEARDWLAMRGYQSHDSCPKHLADLYAAVESRTHEEWKKVVGFGAAG